MYQNHTIVKSCTTTIILSLLFEFNDTFFVTQQKIAFNIYDNKESSTSKNVACNSSLCEQQTQCSSSSGGTCPYQVEYLSENTSTTGFLVEDVLHLITDNDDQTQHANPLITFG